MSFAVSSYLEAEWHDKSAQRHQPQPQDPQFVLCPVSPPSLNIQTDSISCGPLMLSTMLQLNEGMMPTVRVYK